MEGPVADALLKLLRYFHNPELIGSLILLYVVVSGKEMCVPMLNIPAAATYSLGNSVRESCGSGSMTH